MVAIFVRAFLWVICILFLLLILKCPRPFDILNAHLKDFQETAQNKIDTIIEELKTKVRKNTDMFYWIGVMNEIKNQTEEIVINKLNNTLLIV